VFGLGPATRIYVALGATDMRKGFDGLYGIVRDKLGLEVVLLVLRTLYRHVSRAWYLTSSRLSTFSKTSATFFRSNNAAKLSGGYSIKRQMTLDHFVTVRIHARRLSNAIADLRAIYDLLKLNAKTAVIWLLSCLGVLLAHQQHCKNRSLRTDPSGNAI
jgi:IS66 Orf2 like protein